MALPSGKRDRAIAAVRREVWHHRIYAISRSHRDSADMQTHVRSRVEIAPTHAWRID